MYDIALLCEQAPRSRRMQVIFKIMLVGEARNGSALSELRHIRHNATLASNGNVSITTISDKLIPLLEKSMSALRREIPNLRFEGDTIPLSV